MPPSPVPSVPSPPVSPLASGAQTQAEKDSADSKTEVGKNAGFGGADGSQESLTKAGISGGTITLDNGSESSLVGLDRTVTSDKDTAGALTKDWDGNQLLKEVQSGAEITSKALPVVDQFFGDVATPIGVSTEYPS